jgi:hypothetical protein
VVRLQDAECRARRQGAIEHHIDAVPDMETMEVGERDPVGAADCAVDVAKTSSTCARRG